MPSALVTSLTSVRRPIIRLVGADYRSTVIASEANATLFYMKSPTSGATS
jgi:hypothetical protein